MPSRPRSSFCTRPRALRIGTAGWSVPARYKAELPHEGTQLARYAQALTAVEINSTFYRSHRRETYERWAEETPAGFRFSVKMPRAITHFARLKNCNAMLDRFAAEVSALGEKLGVLLVQLPPKLAFDAEAADAFFLDLRACIDVPVALEPRHASWFAPDMDAWLVEREISRVVADPAPVEAAGDPGGWGGLVYYRLHGSPRRYYSRYDDAALSALKTRLDEARARGAEAWCIFDNTASGAAFGNALALSA